MTRVACPSCGEVAAAVRHPKSYRYVESGLQDLWLHGGVTRLNCSACGEQTVSIEKESQLLQVVTMGLLMSGPRLTGPEMSFVRAAAGMTQADLARALDLGRRETIADRESKQDPGLSMAEELGLRVILIRKFLEHLWQPGHSRLAVEQIAELTTFAHAFFEMSAWTNRRAKPLEASLQRHDWNLVRRPRAA